MRIPQKQDPQGAFRDVPPVKEDAELEDVVSGLNRLINSFNFITKGLSISKNFNGYIAEVDIPATSNVEIQHFLGVTPKFRIILRQEGNGVISDIPSGWNNKVITLRNNGAVAVSITVLILRE